MLKNEHFWDLLKDQSDDSVGWWWNWPDEVSWQMTDEKDNDNDKYLVKTLGKWQMKKTTTVETRIIARLQSRDCWVALRSRNLSEKNTYLIATGTIESNHCWLNTITISLSIISINLLWKNRSSQFFQSPIDTSGFANWEEEKVGDSDYILRIP